MLNPGKFCRAQSYTCIDLKKCAANLGSSGQYGDLKTITRGTTDQIAAELKNGQDGGSTTLERYSPLVPGGDAEEDIVLYFQFDVNLGICGTVLKEIDERLKRHPAYSHCGNYAWISENAASRGSWIIVASFLRGCSYMSDDDDGDLEVGALYEHCLASETSSTADATGIVCVTANYSENPANCLYDAEFVNCLKEMALYGSDPNFAALGAYVTTFLDYVRGVTRLLDFALERSRSFDTVVCEGLTVKMYRFGMKTNGTDVTISAFTKYLVRNPAILKCLFSIQINELGSSSSGNSYDLQIATYSGCKFNMQPEYANECASLLGCKTPVTPEITNYRHRLDDDDDGDEEEEEEEPYQISCYKLLSEIWNQTHGETVNLELCYSELSEFLEGANSDEELYYTCSTIIGETMPDTDTNNNNTDFAAGHGRPTYSHLTCYEIGQSAVMCIRSDSGESLDYTEQFDGLPADHPSLIKQNILLKIIIAALTIVLVISVGCMGGYMYLMQETKPKYA